MARITIEIEKGARGGYVIRRDGELAFAASTLPELYEELGNDLRQTFSEAVRLPHATVQRRLSEDEHEAPAPAPAARPSRKPPEVPADKLSAYTVPNPRPPVADLLREQTERMNGHTTGLLG